MAAIKAEGEATAAEVLAVFIERKRVGLAALRKVLGNKKTRAATQELLRAGKIRRVDGGAPIAYELASV